MEMASSSCILWQNESKSVVLLDLPRSIEEAQARSSDLKAADGRPPAPLRRLISALPLASPFPTPEPKTSGSGASAASASAKVAELMTQGAVESALAEIKQSYDGPWCLPRISHIPKPIPPPLSQKSSLHTAAPPPPPPPPPPQEQQQQPAADSNPPESSPPISRTNSPPSLSPSPPPTDGQIILSSDYHLPPKSHPLPGTIESLRPTFLSTAPRQFDLMLLDPPWPNRSAKRKRAGAGTAAYRPAADLASIRSLLSLVPVASHLRPGGLVAVWVTNAPRFADMLVKPPAFRASSFSSSSASPSPAAPSYSAQQAALASGLFSEWGVELVGEWVWLKVTSGGEPVVPVDSAWRKPWERLLIARKLGGGGGGGEGRIPASGPLPDKVIVSVPDVHSRKPNLRRLFEELLPGRYEALEVFARNLTAGWWAWGDEALLFQRKDCWVDHGSGAEIAGAG